MIKINIKKQNILTNSATFSTQTEADSWLAECIANESFGKAEHTVEISPASTVFHPATEFAEAYEEVIEVVYEVVASEYTVEQFDITNELNLQKIREIRNELLKEADIVVNIAYDTGSGIAAAKAYRQALRDVTDAFVADMSLLDAVDPEAFVFPVKP